MKLKTASDARRVLDLMRAWRMDQLSDASHQLASALPDSTVVIRKDTFGRVQKLRPADETSNRLCLAMGRDASAPSVDGNAVLAFRPFAGQTMNFFRDDFVG